MFGKALPAARHHPTEQDETPVLASRLSVWVVSMNVAVAAPPSSSSPAPKPSFTGGRSASVAAAVPVPPARGVLSLSWLRDAGADDSNTKLICDTAPICSEMVSAAGSFVCWFVSLGWLGRFYWTTLWFLRWFPSGSRTERICKIRPGVIIFCHVSLCFAGVGAMAAPRTKQ